MSTAAYLLLENPPARKAARGVLVLSGYGVRLAVERGHLIVEDGVAASRRRARFARIGSGISRVVVIGHSGSVTLEALRWLYETGAAFVQLDHDGRVVTVGGAAPLDDVRVRRGQALATLDGTGLEAARALLVRKVEGQGTILSRLEEINDAKAIVAWGLQALCEAPSIAELRLIESRCAAAYWRAWESVPIRFAGPAAKHVPAHWRTFGARSSALTSTPRTAVTPGNALLNYLYAVLEAEARIAALAVGCDPGLGVIHVDSRSRDSFACDLMEPVRPVVDAYVLDMLRGRTFLSSDFFERRDGNCRLMPALAEPLATTALEWGRQVAPIAEDIAALLQRSATHARGIVPRSRTPLTGRNRSRRRPGRVVKVHRATASLNDVPLPNRCRECGTDLGSRKRKFCEACEPAVARRHLAVLAALSRERAGRDGRSSDAARIKHRSNAARQNQLIATWKAAHERRPEPATFQGQFAVRLQSVPVATMAQATGLSRVFCSRVRKGSAVPHPRHWPAFETLLKNVDGDAGAADHDYGVDPKCFARDIVPHLRLLGVSGIREATGHSLSYSRRILRGDNVPHKRHWLALLRLIQTHGDMSSQGIAIADKSGVAGLRVSATEAE